MQIFVPIATAVAVLLTISVTRAQACTFNAQAACDNCDFTRSYVQYVANPCNCNEYYSCEKTRGYITAHLQKCAICLCFSNETWGCTIRDPNAPNCPVEAPITEQIWTQNNFCYRLGNGPAGPYLQKYQEYSNTSPDKYLFYYWIVDNLPVKMSCPPGTYFNFAQCQCVLCVPGIPCVQGSDKIFCLNFQNNGAENGIWYDQDPTCSVVSDTTLNSNVLLLPGGPCKLEIPYFQKNQFSEFTLCGKFQLATAAPGVIIFDGGRPSDDCNPSISVSVVAQGGQLLVEGSIYTGGPVYTVQHPSAVAANQWYKFCLKYNGQKLEIVLGVWNSATTSYDVPASGSTEMNKCNLLVGSSFDSAGVQHFFEGRVDDLCFWRTYQTNQP